MSEPKKYYRSRTERMIAGVCGGMADYLKVDTIIVRVGWVVLTPLTGGVALLAYVLFWLLAPEEPTTE
jgi:phage shock protein C